MKMILQVVRGERPWSDLSALGITMRLEGNRCAVQNPHGHDASADVHDLAKGLLAHLSKPASLRESALFVNAADVDQAVEDHPASDTVLDALWDAGFGNPIRPDVVRVLEELARKQGSAA